MESTAAVRCPGCGYDNQLEYRYCGMCGGSLRLSSALQAKPARMAAPLKIQSYSILSLDEKEHEKHLELSVELEAAPSADHRLDYLLQVDEAPGPPRWRMYVALGLLAIAAGVLVSQWRRDGYPWEMLSRPQIENAAQPTRARRAPPSPPTEDPAEPVEMKEAAPAPRSRRIMPSPGPQSPVQAEVPDSKPPARGVERDAQVQQMNFSAASERITPESDANSRASNPEAPSTSEAYQLLNDGRNYLYGNGVAKDCDRAQQDLRAAARASAEAKSLLGSMYASGTCVTRSLPRAYRWFALALRNRPDNTRLQTDLKMLWQQMSASEREAASASSPSRQEQN
jgi:hypothetical protein